jgi:hypothetical protein
LIFEYAFPTIPTTMPPNTPIPTQFNEQQILGARYAAFRYLIAETKRWSAVNTIDFNDSSKAEIIVTLISPELLQAVFLNMVLQGHFITSDFQGQLQNMLNDVAAREELLFLLTVTTTSNSVNPVGHTIKIPAQNIVLQNNDEKLLVLSSHVEQSLYQSVDTSSGNAVFGYLAYPFTLLSGSDCKLILNPNYNTDIAVTVPSIEIDGVDSENSLSWTIPDVFLSSQDEPPDFNIPPGFDVYQMTPLSFPPTGIQQANRWQYFARFLWYQITLGN